MIGTGIFMNSGSTLQHDLSIEKHTASGADFLPDHGHKPDRREAMQILLNDIRQSLPFDQPETYLCQKECIGCPKKLMEYLENELLNWQEILDDGGQPSLGAISRLANTGRKIHLVLEKNGLVTPLS